MTREMWIKGSVAVNKHIKGANPFRRDSTSATSFAIKLPQPPRRAWVAALWIACSLPVFANPPEFDFLSFAAVENFHHDKQWCDENYPEFKSKNEILFKQSPYAEMTTEEFIQKHAGEKLRRDLLAALPALRNERRDEYRRMPASFLQRMCSSFGVHLGLTDAQTLKVLPGPEASK